MSMHTYIYTYKCDNMTMFLFVICPLIATKRPWHPKWSSNPLVAQLFGFGKYQAGPPLIRFPSCGFQKLVPHFFVSAGKVGVTTVGSFWKIEQDLTNETLEVNIVI